MELAHVAHLCSSCGIQVSPSLTPSIMPCYLTHTHTYTHSSLCLSFLSLSLSLSLSGVFLAFPDLSLGDSIESQSNTGTKSKGTQPYFASSSIVEVIPCMTSAIEEAPVVSAHWKSVCENTLSNRQRTPVHDSTLEDLETELF